MEDKYNKFTNNITNKGNSRELVNSVRIIDSNFIKGKIQKNQEKGKQKNTMGMIITPEENGFPMPVGGVQIGTYLRLGNWNIRGANNTTKLCQFMEECYN